MSDARAISGVRRSRRQRRPSGAPPPLPHRIGLSTTAWLALAAILVSGAFLVSERTPWLRTGDQASTWLLRQLAAIRTPGLTGVADWINATGVTWQPAIGVAVVLLVIVFRRWRLFRRTAGVALASLTTSLAQAPDTAASSRPPHAGRGRSSGPGRSAR